MAANNAPAKPATQKVVPPNFDWENFDIPASEELPDKASDANVFVPPNIVAKAQESVDKGHKRMSISFRGNEAAAASFAFLVSKAGPYTNPESTVTATQDGIVVRYRAGEKRGRKSKAEKAASNGTESDSK